MQAHNRAMHHLRRRLAWNKGLTKKTDVRIAKSVEKISAGVKKAVKEGRCIGKASTPEKEVLRRQRMSTAALNRTTPSVSKRTEPYVQVDGTIVMLDSSYERKLAKIF